MIKVGIVGYGNLGKACEGLINKENDLKLIKIFTRRDPNSFNNKNMEHLDQLEMYKDAIDVLILAIGSATDIPEMAPKIIKNFNTVDSFDNHGDIPEYYKKIDIIAKKNKKCAFISTGWDPGLFSLNRLISESILTQGHTYTFWGKGVSQGHSDAVRKLEGVIDAVQYTVPKINILENIKNEKRDLKSYETHTREVFVVVEDKVNKNLIEEKIKSMENYFDLYDTTVHFISKSEFDKNHKGIPHGGHVIRVGETLNNNKELYHLSLDLESNPEFTAAINLACVRATYRYIKLGAYGAHTILDTPPNYYSNMTLDRIIERYL